jgi:hypothetical protein
VQGLGIFFGIFFWKFVLEFFFRIFFWNFFLEFFSEILWGNFYGFFFHEKAERSGAMQPASNYN